MSKKSKKKIPRDNEIELKSLQSDSKTEDDLKANGSLNAEIDRKAKDDLYTEITRVIVARNGIPEDLSLVIHERPDIIAECGVIISNGAHELRNSIDASILIGNDSSRNLIAAGKGKHNCVRHPDACRDLKRAGIHNWVSNQITGSRFPLRPFPFTVRHLVFIPFRRIMSAPDVIREGKKRGLELPMYEDALRFWPDYSRHYPSSIIFLHEPIEIDGYSYVFSLSHNSEEKSLSLPLCGGEFGSGVYFAYVRPSKSEPVPKRWM
ncbi:MAG: hypothetical protein AAB407_00180 [Patescibacteria group bacterium]